MVLRLVRFAPPEDRQQIEAGVYELPYRSERGHRVLVALDERWHRVVPETEVWPHENLIEVGFILWRKLDAALARRAAPTAAAQRRAPVPRERDARRAYLDSLSPAAYQIALSVERYPARRAQPARLTPPAAAGRAG